MTIDNIPAVREDALSNPYAMLLDCAVRWPDREALVFDEGAQRLSFGQWLSQVQRLGAGLRQLGVKPGDPVALLAENRIEWPIAQLAIAAIGAVLVPINTHSREEDLWYVLDHSQAVAILLSERFRSNEYLSMLEKMQGQLPRLQHVLCFEHSGYAALLAQPPQQQFQPWSWSPRALASIQYTSGTTGRPKGAELCFEGMLMNAQGTVERLGVTADDRWTSIIPLFHCAGCIMNILAALSVGATYVGIRAFEAGAMIRLVEQERCTILTGVPTSYLAMLEHPARALHDLSSLRAGTCGGADCDPHLLERCASAFPIPGLVQVYGQTEASTLIALDTCTSDDRFVTAGLPITGMQVRVCEPDSGIPLEQGETGQLQVRGPMVMLGYHRDAVETARCLNDEGWMQTGDLGRLREDGRVELVGGRLRDMIIRGGENVYPVEVENLLRAHPAVIEVAVFALPDPYYGEVVAAAVELTEELTKAEVKQVCAGKIAGFKHPSRLFKVQQWPMTSSGKIIKRALQASVLAEQLQELA
ncbi:MULTISPECIES: class I adenylate-forming enzyme family protein [Pseudomonas]|uniref:class I adenylate-forming enzyme family protein n=1 Tax=Pseudomonas TaxID=286 RepID=UPI0007620C7E|nr:MULTISPECIES: class I adenylate-forming enzyme family protein [Pseudomonas]MBA6104639.1 acyl--CoA ligase [Pseudomonas monteilii]